MSAILEGKPDKNLILVTGRTHPKLASDVAEQLGIDILETTAYDFANGEMYVRYTESVRGADVFVLQTHADLVNKSIMEQLIMIDALKRASARSITAVCPLLGYSRQDKKHRGRRADLLPSDLRPAQDRRCRPHHERRPARRAVPGLLRRPGRPPDRYAGAGGLHPRSVLQRAGQRRGRLPGMPAASAWPSSGRNASAAARSPSCTRLVTSRARTRRSPTVWSAMSRARTACSSTT